MTFAHVSRRIIRWYHKNQRLHLPWRTTRDPYKILVSEVMLQQTQVDRVIPKYKEFLKQFPTVKKLAKAKTADVIRAWKGLGYNRRALFLQKTAQMIVKEHNGKFPRGLELLKELPGVGDYTARAILSFAFGKPLPMMDTNHRRFYQRVFFGLQKKNDKILLKQAEKVVATAKDVYDSSLIVQSDAVYRWNQALMDFGSLVCLTGRPLCETCPIKTYCKAYDRLRTTDFRLRPKKQKTKTHRSKTIPFKETDRYFRGQIVDMLREKGSVGRTILRQRFNRLGERRYRKIIAGLEKDGLIKQKGDRILLP